MAYSQKSIEKDDAEKACKNARKNLDDKVEKKYKELTLEEIKYLVFEKYMC